MINTQEDWWEAVDENWDDLLDVFYRYLPMTMAAANNGALAKAMNINALNPMSVEGAACRAYEEANYEAMKILLFAAWERAPDSESIHDVKGWDVLCDLLSEEWVFDES